ncbi:MAG: trypsin-like serine protease [Candidatus Limnocylindrales bacterium]
MTAGHCTFGVGLNGQSTTHDGEDTTAAEGGSGGNDIWISFAAAPDFSILPASSTFGRDENPLRYAAWRDALNGSTTWHRGTATPHPLYNDNQFFAHDAGVVTLASPVDMQKYGAIPSEGWLDRYNTAPRNEHRFETVGYGLELVQGKKDFGGDTRMKANSMLISLKAKPADSYMVLTDNANTGGTCFGDSGGPTFDNTSSNVVVAVTSWAQNSNCTGKAGVYRLDQPDDLDFLAGFGIEP